MTKIFAVFKHFERVNSLKGILGYNFQDGLISEENGMRVFRNLCAEVKVVVKKEKDETGEKPTITRVIGKEVVGKFKGVSTTKKGVPVCEPSKCSHPQTEMKRGGNAHAEKQSDGSVKNVPIQWWTCNLCHSSWERHPLPAQQELMPSGADLVDFGRHKGKTYRELLTHTDYTKWTIETLMKGDPHSKLRRYAMWALNQFNSISMPSHPPAASTIEMEDETPYPDGWEAAGSVAGASSSAVDTAQHFQIGQEDPTRTSTWGYTEEEIDYANRAFHSMMRDVHAQDTLHGADLSEMSADDEL